MNPSTSKRSNTRLPGFPSSLWVNYSLSSLVVQLSAHFHVGILLQYDILRSQWFFRLVFTLATESLLYYLIVYSVFIMCFVLFLVLTNLFKRKLNDSLYRMACNLIILFACGIATSSLNNLTHYLHHKGDALYLLLVLLTLDSTSAFASSPRSLSNTQRHPMQFSFPTSCAVLFAVFSSIPPFATKCGETSAGLPASWFSVKWDYHILFSTGNYGLVDATSRTRTPLQARFTQLCTAKHQSHLRQPKNHVRPCTELRRPDLQRTHRIPCDRNVTLRRVVANQLASYALELESIHIMRAGALLRFLSLRT